MRVYKDVEKLECGQKLNRVLNPWGSRGQRVPSVALGRGRDGFVFTLLDDVLVGCREWVTGWEVPNSGCFSCCQAVG